jgi:hypothetical protein
MFEDCALHRHLLGVFSKLGAEPLMAMSHYIYQSVMRFRQPVSEGLILRFSVAEWLTPH